MRTARLDDLEVSQVQRVIAQFLNVQVISPQGRFNKVFVSLYFHQRYVPRCILMSVTFYLFTAFSAARIDLQQLKPRAA